MKFEIFPNNEKLDTSKKLRVKFGIDPTSDKLHLGHLIPLLEAKRFWLQGHQIDIVLGTFTAQLGDPSGKDTMRPILDAETVKKNAESIKLQIHRIFEDYKNKTAGTVLIWSNHTWFENMNVVEMTKLLAKFTTTQLLSRDSFQKRIENENPIGMHELVVPVLQGFDSVKLHTDVEIGGNDQLFNFKITRDLQRAFDQEPEKCLLMPIINGTDGRKMSKSFGNCIFLNDAPNDVFGKVMSISDELMKEWWPVIWNAPIPLVGHPLDIKKELAWQITAIIWDRTKATEAQNHFEQVVQGKKIPENMMEISCLNVINSIILIRKCSVSEAKRLIKQGAVRVNDVKVEDEKTEVFSGDVIKVGKLDFGKVI
jgi:tyrosyl-tRNA synthetase